MIDLIAAGILVLIGGGLGYGVVRVAQRLMR